MKTSCYKAYAGGNKRLLAPVSACGHYKDNALRNLKRKVGKEWRNHFIWVVYIDNNGQEFPA